MSRILGPQRLSARVRLALASLVVLSFGVLLLGSPMAGTAEGSSCPPGWSSCTSWAANGECCGGSLSWQVREQTCTTWDHDTNAYPTCTYKVVDQFVAKRCKWFTGC